MAFQPQRNALDGPDVLRHVLARLAVAARRRLHQNAMLVAEIDRQAVELEFGRILDRRRTAGQRQRLAHARFEGLGAGRAGLGFGLDGKHRHDVAHRLESRQRLAADPLRRRIRGQQFGVSGLEVLQLAEQLVVLGVRDRRRVEDVVGIIVALDLATEEFRALPCLARNRHQENSRSARTLPATICCRAMRPCIWTILARMPAIISAVSGLPWLSTR